jgi:hypothetical protein
MELICLETMENKYFKKDDLLVGKKYLVYAMEIDSNGKLFYYLINEKQKKTSGCPFWNPYPSELFSIIDHRISRYWTFNNYIDAEDKTYSKKIFAIPEWSTDPVDFYTKFLDNDFQIVNIFNTYKEKMDLEFPDEYNKKYAVLIKDKWLQCSQCDEAWSDDSTLAMVRCPGCGGILNNPNHSLY